MHSVNGVKRSFAIAGYEAFPKQGRDHPRSYRVRIRGTQLGTLSIKNVERREREPEARRMHTPLVATGYYVVIRGVRCRGRRSGCFHVIEKRKI